MAWRLHQLKLPLDHTSADLQQLVCRRLKLPFDAVLELTIVRRSVDARRQQAIALVYSVDVVLQLNAAQRRQLARRAEREPNLQPSPDSQYRLPPVTPRLEASLRPVVVGAGPCGYFAALLLAQMGLRPLLLERGKAIRERTADTFAFWRRQRPLDPESNAQFGEGGAGTFSDGKLYSQVSEPAHYQRKVLEELVAAGANPEILTHAHPHIGTFKLATVVRGLRSRIEALGGTIRFEARVVDLRLHATSRRLEAVQLASGEWLEAAQMVLAPGHSARDVFALLHRHGVAMEAKPFAMGVRVEHPQALIDRARWGAAAGHPRLGAAEYKLVHHCQGEGLAGRSVWSFCMCPGGLVVGAASESGGVVTNGMSQHSRNERNANSALVVNIELDDLTPYGTSDQDPLAGVAFQRHWEARAFALAGGSYAAPSQSVASFLKSATAEPGLVPASYQPGVVDCDLEQTLPTFVTAALREAIPRFERTIAGYAGQGARLTAVETRTSSPVRICRNNTTLECINTPGLFPAGEGAGYAGGILSAAIDGIKVAEQVALGLSRDVDTIA